MTRKYYKGASVAIIAFSTTNKESFQNVQKWKAAVDAECINIPIVLVQTKIDLMDEAQVSNEEGEKLAQKLGMTLFRVCSKTN